MKKPDEKIRQQLWEQLSPQFEVAIDTLLTSREKREKKAELARGLVRVAYLAGLDRGYDLGFVVYGDGDDDSDDSADDEPVDVDEDGEPT